jgi:hypothetical protein
VMLPANDASTKRFHWSRSLMISTCMRIILTCGTYPLPLPCEGRAVG